ISQHCSMGYEGKQGFSCLWDALLKPARRSNALSSYSVQVRRPTRSLLGQPARMPECPCWFSWRGCSGFLAKSTRRVRACPPRLEAPARAGIRHPPRPASVGYYASFPPALGGEPAIAQGYAERCLAISERHGFRQWLGLSRAIQGICAAVLDASASQLDEVKTALDEYQCAGYQLG